MRTSLPNFRRTLLVALAAAALPAGLAAQVVSLRTVPLPVGEQFLVVPARNLGMAGASIALDDPWQDPFVNPAKGARSEPLRIFALPTVYGANGQGGGGASLPAAFLARSGRLFGGGGFVLQAPDDPNVNFWQWNASARVGVPADLGPPANRYGYGLVGWTLGDGRTSVGVGASVASLESVGGVDRLYGNRTWLAEHGWTHDYRVGVLRELPGGASVEGLVLNSRIDMRYDVGRQSWSWDPVTHISNGRYWMERNVDRSSTWGVHLRYLGRPDTAGTRTGFTFTVNRKSYPSLPNYDLAPVPRDPGDSWAFSAGVGTSQVRGKHTVVLEAALEPAWSHTWANAPAQLDTSGNVLVPGGRTSENWFRFINAHALVGFDRRTEWGSWQWGLRLDEIHYSLDRQNYETGVNPNGSDGWFEWTPTWGVMLRAGRAEIRYAGHITTNYVDLGCLPLGGCETKTVVQAPPPAAGGPDFLPPAIGSSSRRFWTAAHQVTVSVPVGRQRSAAAAPLPAPHGD